MLYCLGFSPQFSGPRKLLCGKILAWSRETLHHGKDVGRSENLGEGVVHCKCLQTNDRQTTDKLMFKSVISTVR